MADKDLELWKFLHHNKRLDLLQVQEWSDRVEGPGSGSGFRGAMTEACPCCGGLKPDGAATGGFKKSAIGHVPGCVLADLIKDLAPHPAPQVRMFVNCEGATEAQLRGLLGSRLRDMEEAVPGMSPTGKKGMIVQNINFNRASFLGDQLLQYDRWMIELTIMVTRG